MFKCKSCESKEQHIQDLRAEVAVLRRLAVVPSASDTLTYAHVEADRMLSGSTEPVSMTDVEDAQEADRILSGNYDRAQIEVE